MSLELTFSRALSASLMFNQVEIWRTIKLEMRNYIREINDWNK